MYNQTYLKIYNAPQLHIITALSMINTWHYAVWDCVTILAIYKKTYEDTLKITLNAMCKKLYEENCLPYVCIALF